ncbi:MAG: O-antigen ligase family protein, partial [Flavobacterium sp.]
MKVFSMTNLFLTQHAIPWDLKHNLLLKICLTVLIVFAVGFAETGFLPALVILTLLAFFVAIKPSRSLRFIRQYPIEMHLLNVWLLFSFATGFFISANLDNFFEGIGRTFFYIFICNFIAIILLNRIELINYIIAGLLNAGILQVLSVHLGYGAEYAERTGRAVGLNSNPNSLGLKMVYASAAAVFFLLLRKNRIIFLIISIALLIAFFQVILLSGSRKALLSMGIVLLVFIPLYFTKNSPRLNLKLILIAPAVFCISAILAYYFLPTLLEGTVVGDRIDMGNERGGVEGDIRYTMYQFGLELFYDHPLVGVGFNNFRNYFFTGQYSHSDYVESLSNTGLIGFLLYQSVYLILFIKMLKLFFNSKDRYTRLYSAMGILFIITLKVIGAGVILFNTPTPLVVIAIFSALAFHLK